MNIYVGNLSYTTTQDTLKAFNNMLLVDLREKMLSRVDCAPGDAISKLLITHVPDLEKPFAMSLRTIGTEKTTEFVIDLSMQEHKVHINTKNVE